MLSAIIPIPPKGNAESLLHYQAKILIAKQIEKLLMANQPWNVEWKCEKCFTNHTINILNGVLRSSIEESIGGSRPDIVLRDREGTVVSVVEVVVTSKPGGSYKRSLKNNDIILIQVKLKKETKISDLKLEDLVLVPLGHCVNPKCPKCKEFMDLSELFVIDGACWKFKSPLKVAVINDNGPTRTPPEFNMEEVSLSRKKGVVLKKQYSKTVRNSYLANTCPNCDTFIGEHFLFTDYYCEAQYGFLKHERIFLRYSCMECCEDD